MISWVVQGIIGLASNYIGYQRTKVQLKREAELAKIKAQAENASLEHQQQIALMDADVVSLQNNAKSYLDEIAFILLWSFFINIWVTSPTTAAAIEVYANFPIFLQAIYVGSLINIFAIRGIMKPITTLLKK